MLSRPLAQRRLHVHLAVRRRGSRGGEGGCAPGRGGGGGGGAARCGRPAQRRRRKRGCSGCCRCTLPPGAPGAVRRSLRRRLSGSSFRATAPRFPPRRAPQRARRHAHSTALRCRRRGDAWRVAGAPLPPTSRRPVAVVLRAVCDAPLLGRAAASSQRARSPCRARAPPLRAASASVGRGIAQSATRGLGARAAAVSARAAHGERAHTA